MKPHIIYDWITLSGYRVIILNRTINNVLSFYCFIEIPKTHPKYGIDKFKGKSLDYYGNAYPIETNGWWIGYLLKPSDDFKKFGEELALELKTLDQYHDQNEIYKFALKTGGIIIIFILLIILLIFYFS